VSDEPAQQFDPGARIYIREAIAFLRRQHPKCDVRYCENCVITKNLDDARRWLFPHDPLGDVDPDSPWAGCPGVGK
jgi:hypothetical protein